MHIAMSNSNEGLTLTSRLGRFTFDKDVLLSHAKMIRDSIVGQFFSPRTGEPKIKTEQDAHEYAMHFLGRDFEDIEFSLEITVQMEWDHPYKIVDEGVLMGTPIDVEIYDLIVALTELGWNTHMSCQDNHDDRAWVSFYHANWAVRFLELIANKGGDILRNKVLNATTEMYDKNHDKHRIVEVEDRWWVDSFVQALYDDEEYTGDICIRISVRFPRKHLEEVTRIVTQEAARKRGHTGSN